MNTVKIEIKRKNIDIPPDVFKSLSIMAAQEGTNLKRYIENLLLEKANKLKTGESPLKKAADLMRSDYLNDKQLTAFTNIDTDDFYETK